MEIRESCTSLRRGVLAAAAEAEAAPAPVVVVEDRASRSRLRSDDERSDKVRLNRGAPLWSPLATTSSPPPPPSSLTAA